MQEGQRTNTRGVSWVGWQGDTSAFTSVEGPRGDENGPHRSRDHWLSRDPPHAQRKCNPFRREPTRHFWEQRLATTGSSVTGQRSLVLQSVGRHSHQHPSCVNTQAAPLQAHMGVPRDRPRSCLAQTETTMLAQKRLCGYWQGRAPCILASFKSQKIL